MSDAWDDAELEAWVREHVSPAGPSEVAFERPWARVRQVPVADGVVWVKLCAPVQAFEPTVTAALSARWPDLMPQVIAHEPQRGWLLLADAGERLGIGGDPDPWLELLPRYGELQRSEAGHVDQHLHGDVPDRRLERFPELYASMLAHGLPLDGPSRDRLMAFSPRFGELCEELAAAAIAETNQHDDLHGNNVYRRNGRLRILDWFPALDASVYPRDLNDTITECLQSAE